MITLYTPEVGAEAKFTINGTAFVKELKLISSIFKSGASIMLGIEDEKLVVIATDNTKSLILEIVTAKDISGRGCFIIDIPVLTGILNNRSDISFIFKDASLKFKAIKGKYTGDMSTEPVTLQVIEQLNDTFNVEVKDISLPDSIFSVLDKSMKYVNLTDSYGELDTELIRYIIGEGNKVKIITYDQFHSAILETTLENPLRKSFKIAVYKSYFAYINSLARGDKLSIAITDKFFYVKSDKFFISLPPIQYKDDEFNNSYELISDLMASEKTSSCELVIKEFSTVIENLCSIYERGSKIEVKTASNSMQLKLTTNYGTMEDVIRLSNVEGKGSIGIDAPPIKDVLSCVPTTPCKFSFINGKAYILEFETEDTSVSYMVAVLQ